MFNYEQSIWGRGEASLRWGDPTSFRLRQALEAICEIARRTNETSPSVPLLRGEGASSVSVLEVGCGAGQFIRAIKKIRPELNCLGCDISREAIEEAAKMNDGVDYSVCDATKLPYADGTIDAVSIFDVLEHVEDPAATVGEIRRVLKPGGILYAFVPCEGDWTSLWRLLDCLGLKQDLTKKYAGHINYFSRRSLLNLFQSRLLKRRQTPPSLPLERGGGEFKVEKIRYSEHLLGQLLGIAAFVAMDHAAKKKKLSQINNETYFAEHSSVSRFFRSLVNSIVYLESIILSRVPSPNAHITLIKK